MHGDHSRPLAAAVLLLGLVLIAGMLLASWRLVLYPSLALMGVLLGMGLRRQGAVVSVAVPVGVVALLAALYALLDVMGLARASGTGDVFGWDPLTAVYLLGLGAAFLSVGLLYGLLFPRLQTTAEGTGSREEPLR